MYILFRFVDIGR